MGARGGLTPFKQRDLSPGSGASAAWELSQAPCSRGAGAGAAKRRGAGSPGARAREEGDNPIWRRNARRAPAATPWGGSPSGPVPLGAATLPKTPFSRRKHPLGDPRGCARGCKTISSVMSMTARTPRWPGERGSPLPPQRGAIGSLREPPHRRCPRVTPRLARWAADKHPASSRRELSPVPRLAWEGDGTVGGCPVASSARCPWPQRHRSGSWRRSGFSLPAPPLPLESRAFLLLPPSQWGLGSVCRAAPWKRNP